MLSYEKLGQEAYELFMRPDLHVRPPLIVPVLVSWEHLDKHWQKKWIEVARRIAELASNVH